MSLTPDPGLYDDHFMHTHIPRGSRRVPIGTDGSTVPADSVGRIVIDEVGALYLKISFEDGKARVKSLTINEWPEGAGLTDSGLAQIPLMSLLAKAIELNIIPADLLELMDETNEDRWVAEARTAARRRLRLTDERLDSVMADHEEGGIVQVTERHHVSERHGYRLLKEARARREGPS